MCKYLQWGQWTIGPCKGPVVKTKFIYKKPVYVKKPVIPVVKIPQHQGSVWGKQYQACVTTDGLQGLCREPAYCYNQYDTYELYNVNRCECSKGLIGICCPIKEIRVPQIEHSEYQMNTLHNLYVASG